MNDSKKNRAKSFFYGCFAIAFFGFGFFMMVTGKSPGIRHQAPVEVEAEEKWENEQESYLDRMNLTISEDEYVPKPGYVWLYPDEPESVVTFWNDSMKDMDEATFDRLSTESRARAVARYPFLDDPDDPRRERFDDMIHNMLMDPRHDRFFESSRWRESLAENFAQLEGIEPTE